MDATNYAIRKDSHGTAASANEIYKFIDKESNILDDGLGPKWMFWKRRRYLVMIMAFFGSVAFEALRTNLSVAILVMTENRTATDENGTTQYVPEFEWDMKTRGFLLSLFFYGFIASILPGGILAVKFGGTKLYGLGLATTAFLALLTPTAADIHIYLLISLRILEGICEGVLVPSLELIYAMWTPLQERSALVSIVSTGYYWGVFFGIAVSSSVAQHWGWRYVFYFTGGLVMLWYLVWILLVKDNPSVDKMISPSELLFIQNSQKPKQKANRKVTSIPYFKIITSLPLSVLIFGDVPIYSGYIALTTMIPVYLKDVLNQDTQNSGYLTCLPLGIKIFTMYSISPTADWLINRRILTTGMVRKLYICGGLICMAIFYLLIQLTTSTYTFVACLIAIHMFAGVGYTQLMVNMLDLAPSYSSVMSGLLGITTSLCGMSIPTIIGYLTPNKKVEEWITVFSMLAGTCLLAAVMYGLFGSGQLQPWATEKVRNRKTRDVEEECLSVIHP